MSQAPTFLADRSALARLRDPVVARRFDPLVEYGLVATCAIVELEVLYSTRSGPEWTEVRKDRRAAYPTVPITEAVCQRAIEVQGELWTTGRVRAGGIADLLIAAAAEAAQITVLHYDADFDQIRAVTGQACEWVVPRGSVP